MKYIKNNYDKDLLFKAKKGNLEVEFVFPCFTVFTDTGNVASTGVTEISESDYDLLLTGNSMFKSFVTKGIFTESKKDVTPKAADTMKAMQKENENLKKDLLKAQKEAEEATKKAQEAEEATKKAQEAAENVDSKDLKKLKEENKSLKKQLEDLAKQSKVETSTEGF